MTKHVSWVSILEVAEMEDIKNANRILVWKLLRK
jgi:hypothetical protein